MRAIIHVCLFLLPILAIAGPAVTSDHLHIDQFGYRPAAQKVCVISDPQVGFNAPESFAPGSTYEVRRWNDDVSVFNASITAWNGGATHGQSGDKAWWFDFSSVTTPGDYYVFDPTNNVGSYRFTIGEDVYNTALKYAVRMYYHQRCGVAKPVAHAGDWQDAVCHTHALQDLNCRSVSAPNNAATEKELSGGWHDAGDFTKYVNFSWSTVHDLLFAYQGNPDVFGDDYGIPESGNGVPDILDELKFELDWLVKMQQADGSVLMKVSVPCFEAASPASADLTQRMYGPAQASSTRTVASMFAHAAIVYSGLSNATMQTYGANLLAKAELAWTWINANPGTSNYNNSGFCSANPEISADDQNEARTGAAALLFAATGNTTYRTYFDNNYSNIRPYQWTYWYAFQPTIQDIMLYYASLPNATASVANNIKNSCTTSTNTNNADMLPAWTGNLDAYRAYLKDNDYVWGSNRWKANAANIFYNMVEHNLYPSNNTHYLNAAENYVHFLHGANPINKLMLTNMGDYGAEKSCDEMYHAWFGDGTVYDNAQTSLYGPPPGYLTGGFNPNFVPAQGYISPPQGQPHQKSYKDWNTSWPENSWELTEPAIYSQAAYIKLVSKFASESIVLPAELSQFSAALLRNSNTVLVEWAVDSWTDVDVWHIERSADGIHFDKIGMVKPATPSGHTDSFRFVDAKPHLGSNYYRLRRLDLNGQFEYSGVREVTVRSPLRVSAQPNPVHDGLTVNMISEMPLQPASIRLLDFSGRPVFVKDIETVGGQHSEVIGTAHLPAGIYLLEVRCGDASQMQKVVVGH
ncbi:MAG: glycoside hydrolase family 9 protein [Saprospiraceae bacterium]|nr:glycoside hydrolase family 9 protein [Saprospiraceae bacterium]